MSVPDYPLEATVDFKFTTRSTSGVPTTLSGSPAIEIYEDNGLTQITAAETLTVDFDSVTGLNNLRVAMTAANGFESGKSYHAVISAGTVGGTSVVGEVVQQFSIERSPALRPTTAGRTLDVTSTGAAGIDWGNVENPTTAVDLSATDIQLVDTVTTLTGHTAQTGDNFARLGAPAGASVSADIAAVKVDTAATLVDTNELQTDWVDGGRLDLLIDAIKALLDDARTEPGQGAPPVNPDLATKIDYLYKAWRNKHTQTSTQYSLFADDTTTVDQKATVSDDSTTFTRGEVATGP